MRVWAHTLFRNEERFLWYSVSSVIDYVDRLLLWDTGSTDDSWKIARVLKKRYSDKIQLRQFGQIDASNFYRVRQEMLEETSSDWFLVVDADEVWYETSIKELVGFIKKNGNIFESIVVPTLNFVGDLFHIQEEEAGRYEFKTIDGLKKGNYALRAINRSIPGLFSKGRHGIWGWADGEGKMIQDRNPQKIGFLDFPYCHMTFLKRSRKDQEVPKRSKKLKYEMGRPLPSDFYYPEVFFWPRPHFIPSLWEEMDNYYKMRAFFETPLRKINRIIFKKVGY